MYGNRLLDTQYRTQDPPEATAARNLYPNYVAAEYRLYHTPLNVSNKISEHNALNAPLTPAMIVWAAAPQLHSLQTARTVSRSIRMPIRS